MKKLLTTSMLCMFVGANAEPLGSILLESAPTSAIQQSQKAKESSDDGGMILVPNKPSDQKSDKSKLAEAKNKKHHHKKRAKRPIKGLSAPPLVFGLKKKRPVAYATIISGGKPIESDSYGIQTTGRGRTLQY